MNGALNSKNHGIVLRRTHYQEHEEKHFSIFVRENTKTYTRVW